MFSVFSADSVRDRVTWVLLLAYAKLYAPAARIQHQQSHLSFLLLHLLQDRQQTHRAAVGPGVEGEPWLFLSDFHEHREPGNAGR